MKLRKLLCMFLALILVLQMPLAASALSWDAERCIQDMLNYYRYYQTEASENIDSLLKDLRAADSKQGEAWEKMMNSWQWVDQSMPVYNSVLPYGLPQDDSLAIVVMGYSLNANGTMKSEMEDRLIVALASAQRYPNAYIVCTGGATARYSSNTEAGVMAKWLKNQGISSQRIIVEDQSYSTGENAINTYEILTEEYPQIKSVAVITSNYHIYRSALAFQAMSDYASALENTQAIPVVASACCWTAREDRESLTSQAEVLAQIAGLELEYQKKPALSGSGNQGNGQTSGGSTGWESYWEGYVPSTGTPSKPQEEVNEDVSDNAGTSGGETLWQNPWLSTDANTQVQDYQSPWQ